jgi:predicted DNA-binding transcriptional regulator AlpA
MKNYHFAIVASGLDPKADDFEDRFFEAGCSDATISFQKGLTIVEFDREAKNFAHAITSAFADVHRTGATVERFEPDYLVSLSDIAARSGLSRAAISLYCKGERKADFPSPVARVTSESPLWDWVDVARWMHLNVKLSREVVLEARMVREANLATLSRSFAPAQFRGVIEKVWAEEAA